MDMMEALNYTCGLDEDNTPKSGFTILNGIIKEGIFNQLDELTTFGPEIAVWRMGDFIYIDFKFRENDHYNLKRMWEILEEYGIKANAFNEKDTEISACGITIVPIEFEGLFFLQAKQPVFWGLTPREKDDETSILRTVFDVDDFELFQTENLDIATVKANVEREIEERENMIFQAELEEARRMQEENENSELHY